MRRLILVLLVLCTSACAHHAPKAGCDGHLTPINPANPVQKPPTAAPTS
jgi:hypothetical protein